MFVLGLIICLLLGGVTYLSIDNHIKTKQIEALNNEAKVIIEKEREIHEAAMVVANDSIETLYGMVTFRDDSIKTLNDDYNELETLDDENANFVNGLDTTGLLNVLTRIKSKYHIHWWYITLLYEWWVGAVSR